MTDQFAQPTPAFQPAQPKTSGMAITSLVFGILSFCLWIFGSIPAIILGIVALSKINKSQGQLGGKGLAIGGLVTGGAGILVGALAIGMMLPVIGLAREKANRINCMGQMRQVLLACKEYANDDVENQYFPPDMQTLVKGEYIKDTKVFVCPSSKFRTLNPADVDNTSDFVYVGNGLKDDGGTDWIVIYCKAHGSAGCNVGYADGHLVWKSASPAQLEMMAKSLKEQQQMMNKP